jgi:hypothetical protein
VSGSNFWQQLVGSNLEQQLVVSNLGQPIIGNILLATAAYFDLKFS